MAKHFGSLAKPSHSALYFLLPILLHHSSGCVYGEPLPLLGFTTKTLNYTIFKPNDDVYDNITRMKYTKTFDPQMDVVYGDTEISVGETWWLSAVDPNQLSMSVENVISYNRNLVSHVSSSKGTTVIPNRTFQTFLFTLFNENLKPSTSERNYELFRPDLTLVYQLSTWRTDWGSDTGNADTRTTSPESGTTWCVPKVNVNNQAL